MSEALDLAAKRVADERQHGCHYAEGTCPECRAIARTTIGAFLEYPHLGISDEALKRLRELVGQE